MEHLSHLAFGVATCAGVRHRQARRDAVGREEDVARAGLELRVKVQCEGSVAVNDSFDLPRLCRVRAEQNYQTGENEPEESGILTHGDLPFDESFRAYCSVLLIRTAELFLLLAAIQTASVQVGARSTKGTNLNTKPGAKAQCHPMSRQNQRNAMQSSRSSAIEKKPGANRGKKPSWIQSMSIAEINAKRSRRRNFGW